MTAAIVALAVATVALVVLALVLLALLVGAWKGQESCRIREAAMLLRLQQVEARAAEGRVQAATVPTGAEGAALAAEIAAGLAGVAGPEAPR